MNFILILIICIVLLFIIFKIVGIYNKKKAYKLIYQYLNNKYKNVLLGNKIYDYYIEDIDSCIKVLFLNENDELVINSKYIWQINHDMKIGNTPSSSQNVLGIKNFMNINKNKIVIIYSTCYSIKKYINECEMIFVNENTDCYGVKFLKFKDLNQKEG